MSVENQLWAQAPISALTGARLLHTMFRVKDLERSLEFYVQKLGMRLLRRKDFLEGRFTLAFVGYGEEHDVGVLELTHNWGESEYSIGTAYGHVAIGVTDVYAAVKALDLAGVSVTRPAGPLKGDPDEHIAFVQDPDGYKIELIQNR